MAGQDLIGPLLSWRWVCLRKEWLPRVGWQRMVLHRTQCGNFGVRAGKRRSPETATTIVGLKSSPRAEGMRVRSESWRVVSLRWGESVCHPGLTVSLDWGTRRWFWCELSGSGGADQRPSDRPELEGSADEAPTEDQKKALLLSMRGDTSAWLWSKEVDRADL